ncbi:DUF2306 domain-containing protein [Streptomyces rhizosphaerihabitans]|uniref:DUF2306 domain-containing protein n=1 Tax=Streptomyces rhizosphaerihabitans TaxID=1266770 RepID=UPI0021C17677|nr:DUF2306 domain-containing protein [Streptomyces rhizosphaerihabitans]MCT9007502.1 DUF2306 domain-containing protein [Streptomyces rhizosphaerihabitans]
MRRSTGNAWRRVALIAVSVVCVGYAPIAMTELWPYARPGAPAFGEWILAHVVSPRYVADALATRIGPYRHSLVPMIVHSVLGGVLMLLGPAQVLTAVRRRTRLHRVLGTVFAVTVYASMAGAALYLARTAPEDAFSGAAFWIVLATILVGTVMSVTFGVLAAVGGFPDLHQRWMLLCYGFLLTAPLLRFEWGGLPLILPGLSMAEINQVATMHLGSIVAFGALIASRSLDRRTTVAGVSRSWAPVPALAVAHLAGAAALTWIARASLDHGTQGRRLLLAYLLPYAGTYAVMAVCARRAGREGRLWAREEWRLHWAALCLAPVLSAGAAPILERSLGLDGLTALAAGAAIGCGAMAVTATLMVSVRVMYAREVLKRAVPAPGSASRLSTPVS